MALRTSVVHSQIAMVLLVLSFMSGCGAEKSETESLGDWFKENQDGVVTPSGPIDGDSVRQDGEAVIFDTATETYRQEYRPSQGGGYERVGDPERITEVQSP